MNAPRHFLDIDALDTATLRTMLDHAHTMKAAWKAGHRPRPCADLVLAAIFEKPSTRTRVSFDLAMRQLGGETMVLAPGDMQLGRGETIADTARVLSRYVDAIVIRTARHRAMLELARHSGVPVVNGLTDRSHPCQVLADVMTLEERLGSLANRQVAWAGDGNNMACSWIHAALRFGFTLRLACPPRHRPPGEVLARAVDEGARIAMVETLAEAVAGADCVTTDTWTSMSDEGERSEVDVSALEAFRIDAAAMALARPEAIFLHCMPLYRGQEVAAEVADGPQSAIFDQAENRLHAQKAILTWCLARQPG